MRQIRARWRRFAVTCCAAAIVQAVPGALEETPAERHARGVNHSSLHVDFMIGSNELTISGVTPDGDEVTILAGGEWRL